jgi:hypothetical protein
MRMKQKLKSMIFGNNNLLSFVMTLTYGAARNQGLAGMMAFPQYAIRACGLYHYLRQKKGLQSYLVTPTDTLIFILQNRVIKYALSAQSRVDLCNACEMHTALKKSTLRAFVPYNMHCCNDVIIMDRLYPINLAAYNIRTILDAFAAAPAPKGTFTLHGLMQSLKDTLPDIQALNALIPDDYTLQTGLMHGDLTPSNVMQTHENELALIDWDRSDPQGVPLYDEMHYAIELKAKAASQYSRYYAALGDLITACKTQGALLPYVFYFLYRLSLETRNSRALPAADIMHYNALIQKFIAKHHMLNKA